MKLNNRKIAVIGAGVAGLATARALALRGARPIVVEQARDLGEVGAGLQITPNGMAVLDALGLGKRVRDAGLPIDDVSLHDHRAASRVLRLRLDKSPSAGNWLAIPRADLIRIMRDGVERVGAEVRTGARVVRIETRPQKTILNLADGRTLEAAIVIAADGLHSLGRQSLGGGATPFFTGQVAWRALIDDDAGASPVAQVFMAPGRHLVSYPLPGGKRNIVAVEEQEDWAEESWTATGEPDQLRAAFTRFGGPVPGWLDRVSTTHLWGLFRHEIPARWHGGSLVLVGDAAHPTLPFLAQGANLALEDAWVLADTLADAPGVSAALTTFQERRIERVKRAIRAANSNARNYHLRNPLVRFAAHTGLRIGSLLSPRSALGRFDWLYRHDVTAAAADKPNHVSVRELPPLAVTGAPAEPTRTPKPVVPLAKPVVGPRQAKSRITFSKTAPKISTEDTPTNPPAKAPATVDEPPTKPSVTIPPHVAEIPAKEVAAKIKSKVAPPEPKEPPTPTPSKKPAASAPPANPYGDDTAAGPKPAPAAKRAVSKATSKPATKPVAEGPAKESSTKTVPAKKPAGKKPIARKPVTKKTVAKKPAAKGKATAAPTKKAKKPTAKSAPAKKS